MGRSDAVSNELERLAQALCEELGLELVQVSVHPHRETLHLQVMADRPEGGIGMEECAQLNRRLAAAIDSQLALGDNYTLEVASPGLDRPLAGYRDLRRVLGRDLQVFLKEPLGGKREISGTLLAVAESEAIVRTRQGEVRVPMGSIEKAKQIIK